MPKSELMKVLVLSPQLNASHQLASFLEQRGVYSLFVNHSNEVLPTLQIHEQQVDLLVLDCESLGSSVNAVQQWIEQFKANPSCQSLALILITKSWSSEQCALHQETSTGAHAYLSHPFEPEQLWQTIQSIFGATLPERSQSLVSSSAQIEKNSALISPMDLPASEESSSARTSLEPHLEASSMPNQQDKALEDVSMVFTRSELAPETQSSIVFEQPEFQVEPESAPSSAEESSAPPQDSPSLQAQSGATLSIPTLVQSPDQTSQHLGVSDSKQPQKKSNSTPEAASEVDSQAAQEMPYLFKRRSTDLSFAEPMGDAVIPGGVAQTPDLETFKHYLLLREQDVAILSAQLKSAQEQIESGAKVIAEEHAQNVELLHLCQEQKKKIEELAQRHAEALESREKYIGELQFHLRMKTDEIRHLEHATQKAIEETEQLKERVRIDIRKIRTREKELENRLEIMKKDSEAMISTRETTIIELKRQLDLLEFNMDLVQVQYTREKEISHQLKERLLKASQAVRLAEGLLESQVKGVSDSVVQSPVSDRKEKAS